MPLRLKKPTLLLQSRSINDSMFAPENMIDRWFCAAKGIREMTFWLAKVSIFGRVLHSRLPWLPQLG